MSQISLSETTDLLSKLFEERIRLQVFVISDSRTRVSFWGFVDSITREDGVTISASGPPIDLMQGYVRFFPFGDACEFWYGEKRELPPEVQASVAHARGSSCLLFSIRGPFGRERVGLYFDI